MSATLPSVLLTCNVTQMIAAYSDAKIAEYASTKETAVNWLFKSHIRKSTMAALMPRPV